MTYITKESALQAISDYTGGAVDKTVAKEILKGIKGVEIIRCKNCKYFGDPVEHLVNAFHCNLNGVLVGPKAFCSCAERRDNG